MIFLHTCSAVRIGSILQSLKIQTPTGKNLTESWDCTPASSRWTYPVYLQHWDWLVRHKHELAAACENDHDSDVCSAGHDVRYCTGLQGGLQHSARRTDKCLKVRLPVCTKIRLIVLNEGFIHKHSRSH